MGPGHPPFPPGGPRAPSPSPDGPLGILPSPWWNSGSQRLSPGTRRGRPRAWHEESIANGACCPYCSIARCLPDRLLAFLLPKLDSSNERLRVGSLQILRHVINAAGECPLSIETSDVVPLQPLAPRPPGPSVCTVRWPGS